MYADDNHKPEMALALSDDFQALCSFAPLATVAEALRAHPELAGLVGQERAKALERAAAGGAGEEAAKEVRPPRRSSLLCSCARAAARGRCA